MLETLCGVTAGPVSHQAKLAPVTYVNRRPSWLVTKRLKKFFGARFQVAIFAGELYAPSSATVLSGCEIRKATVAMIVIAESRPVQTNGPFTKLGLGLAVVQFYSHGLPVLGQ